MRYNMNYKMMLRLRLRTLYKEIENCNGVQTQQMWAEVGEIKKKLRK